jgi:hypothetical protein
VEKIGGFLVLKVAQNWNMINALPPSSSQGVALDQASRLKIAVRN